MVLLGDQNSLKTLKEWGVNEGIKDVCVCVCVCVRERDRETERERGREKWFCLKFFKSLICLCVLKDEDFMNHL